jgi:predicted transcriptional regulator
LGLFVYAIRYVISSVRSRELEVERWDKKKLQLFYEILCAIEDEIDHHKVARPTHIQHNCRLSYDKMMNHIVELEHKYMIYRANSTGLISLTSKGKKFVKQYNELINLIESAGL